MPQDGVSNEGSRIRADVEMETSNGPTMLPASDLFEHDEEQMKMESIKEQLAALQVLSPPMAEWPTTRHCAARPVCRVTQAARSKLQVGRLPALVVPSLRQLRGTCGCTGINLYTRTVAYKQAQLAKNPPDLDAGRARGIL